MEDSKQTKSVDEMDVLEVTRILLEIISGNPDSEMHRKVKKALELGLYEDDEQKALHYLLSLIQKGVDRLEQGEDRGREYVEREANYTNLKTFILTELGEDKLNQCTDIHNLIALVNALLQHRGLEPLYFSSTIHGNDFLIRDMSKFPHRTVTTANGETSAIVFLDNKQKVSIFTNAGGDMWFKQAY